MKREEQIKEASIDFQMATNPRCIAGEAFADFAREMNVNQSFIEGAKWADKTMIDRVCEWLKENASSYMSIYWEQGGYATQEYDIEKMINDFKKAMEE